ncbi:MAG: epoxyqueuosine reductase QueH [Thermoleophilia bacterium]
MKLLLHICCAPCSTVTIQAWRQKGADVTGTYYNPNIHPLGEHQLRYDTLLAYASKIDLPLVGEPAYDIVEWLRMVSGREQKGERCRPCIAQRLSHVANLAGEAGFDSFSTSLLVSPWQEHEIIIEEGRRAARSAGVEFAYHDLRPLYRESIKVSRSAGLYRQKYCGCIYSEAEAVLQKLQRSRKV